MRGIMFNCVSNTHILANYVESSTRLHQPLTRGVSTTTNRHPLSTEHLLLPKPLTTDIQILHSSEPVTLTALIVSGADSNFMDITTAKKLHISLRKLNNPPTLHGIDG